jgi:hypothetical protein
MSCRQWFVPFAVFTIVTISGPTASGSAQEPIGPEPRPGAPTVAQTQDAGSSGPARLDSPPAYEKETRSDFFKKLYGAYVDEFKGTAGTTESGPEPVRRAAPSPFNSPPFPSSEYQGYPLLGIPPSTREWPLMKAMSGSSIGDALKSSRIRTYGWVTGAYNWSTADNSNQPTSYWIVPRAVVLDQAVLRVEREVDTTQTDHIDWGFRSTNLYGVDYRYMTAGGWGKDQLVKRNQLYGFDPTELYMDMYIPKIAQGLILRVGRWVATPDIETQFAPDNYMGSHTLQFTFDTYTQTGVMATVMLNKQWTIQGAVHSGTDMAPWYRGAVPTGMVGVRWVAADNNDSVYFVLNNVNTAKYRHFEVDGQPSGHDNFNYAVGTWQHRVSEKIHTKLAGIYMWQRDGVLGGTANLGPVRSFGSGGGQGATLPGMSTTYGILNYTMFQTSSRNYITVRNEWWRDERGMRSGFAGDYSSHAVGFSHQFNDVVMIRPEIGYYRSYNKHAFDGGTERDLLMIGFDTTFRF